MNVDSLPSTQDDEVALLPLDGRRIHAVIRRQLERHLFNVEEECPCRPYRIDGGIVVHNYLRPTDA